MKISELHKLNGAQGMLEMFGCSGACSACVANGNGGATRDGVEGLRSFNQSSVGV